MVSEQGVNETLGGQTLAENRTEETAAISATIAAAIDARIGAAWMNGFNDFRQCQ